METQTARTRETERSSKRKFESKIERKTKDERGRDAAGEKRQKKTYSQPENGHGQETDTKHEESGNRRGRQKHAQAYRQADRGRHRAGHCP